VSVSVSVSCLCMCLCTISYSMHVTDICKSRLIRATCCGISTLKKKARVYVCWSISLSVSVWTFPYFMHVTDICKSRLFGRTCCEISTLKWRVICLSQTTRPSWYINIYILFFLKYTEFFWKLMWIMQNFDIEMEGDMFKPNYEALVVNQHVCFFWKYIDNFIFWKKKKFCGIST